MTIEFINTNHKFFPNVKQLGKNNSSTLGFMPEGGFVDHANKKCIVIAHDADQFAGYLMYRESPRRQRIAIVHLCVHDKFRGKNISSLLLDALRDKYSNNIYKGILLSCRNDYKYASKVWKRYGFVCKSTIRSRSIEENYLNIWWYDFNIPDLFTSTTQYASKIKVILDANIIMKLRDNDVNIEPSQDARSLLADWLVEEVDYYYAPEINNEILRDLNLERRKQTRAFLGHFIEAKFNIEDCKSTTEKLKSILAGNSENDHSDRVQLATAITSEASYFVTLDFGIIHKRDEVEDLYDIIILTPQELVLEIDQLLNKKDYSPNKLAGATLHSISKVSSLELNLYIDLFLEKSLNESKKEFRNIVCNDIENTKDTNIKTVQDKKNTIAFYGYKYRPDILHIHFIRVANTALKETLFMQLITECINEATINKLNEIHIYERFLSDNQKGILIKMGFDYISGTWVKISYNNSIFSSEIKKLPKNHYTNKIESCSQEEKHNLLLHMERKFFPLKILDLEIPCYIIPIKPYWAGQLFDSQISGTSLFGADERIIWNFENVYYRSTRPITENAPGRILWYASNDNNSSKSKSIIASSYLDEVMTGRPLELFRKNKHYGVYEWNDIYKLCKQDKDPYIRALRFSGTEIFSNPISFTTIKSIFLTNNRPANTFASPVKIGINIYNQIYKLGKGNEL